MAALLVRTPATALGVLIMSMFLYPEYLRVPIGLAEMSAPRVIALALLARLLCSDRRRFFSWKLIDVLIIVEWVWGVAATAAAGAEQAQVVYMIGRFFDTTLMYFVARLAFVAQREWRGMVLPLVIVAVTMAALGSIEAATSYNPYRWMVSHAPWTGMFQKDLNYRFGLLRAQVSTSHPIYFGIAMVILGAQLFAIRGVSSHRIVCLLGSAAALVAALCSMSSGPQQALLVLLFVNLLYWRPIVIKPLLLFVVLVLAFCELFSNRHFYYLIEYLNFFGGDYWYRARLVEVAIENLHEYWLVGFGGLPPHHWGPQIDGRLHVDVVNHYVYIAVLSGVFGILLLLGTQCLALREAVSAWCRMARPYRELVFGHGAIIIAIAIASMSVGLFSGALLMTYINIGLMVRWEPSKRRAQFRNASRATTGLTRKHAEIVKGAASAPTLAAAKENTLCSA